MRIVYLRSSGDKKSFNCVIVFGNLGFKGKTCNIDVDECMASLPCKHGSCIDGINNYTCNCTGSGYTGPTCSDDINECKADNPCHPNASCINYPGTYQCNCQKGFTGKNCYENIDDCRSNPCKNGGMCCVSSINLIKFSCLLYWPRG